MQTCRDLGFIMSRLRLAHLLSFLVIIKVNQSKKVINARHESPETEVETDFSDSEIDPRDLTPTTATRHSTRTSGKSFNFAESSSTYDAIDLDIDTNSSVAEDKEVGASLVSTTKFSDIHEV
ncbi:root hair initiation protein root hairless 1 (RHL1) [Artemisia annua]|uniref:Root hair initiation protein root hairless 1 (RHL1) n=1 Tax=Artemisia annua TaxID=35608 RepID=A0A2U1P8I2_ARTAN|nr:root hair initiation protein root hairless 1 (RHL1) [Artemisia annua]